MRGQNWTPIYIAVVLVIAAILLFAIIKPMFQSAGQYASSNLPLLFI